MHPTTHILTGWCLAELVPSLTRREKTAIVVAAAVPDLDGLGVIAELATRDSEHPLLWWTEYHHILGHNLSFGVVFAVIAGLVCRSLRAGVLSFVAVHLHILGDILGSRGPDDYQWPIPYLYPFRDEPQLAWAGQWYLNAWPNFIVTAVLMAVTLFWAWRWVFGGGAVLGAGGPRVRGGVAAAVSATS